MRRTIALITSLCLSLSMLVPAFAQGAKMTVSGVVTTPKGQAVLGASVIVKGAPSRGVIVDDAGNYSIQTAKGEILVYCLRFCSVSKWQKRLYITGYPLLWESKK